MQAQLLHFHHAQAGCTPGHPASCRSNPLWPFPPKRWISRNTEPPPWTHQQCAWQEQQQRQELIQQIQQRALEEQEAGQPAAGSRSDLNVSGEEAFLRRGRSALVLLTLLGHQP